MNVDLSSLQPNPTRNFKIDPIEPERVELLRQSIRDYGFWSGVVCRKTKDGTIEIGAGHTRVQAALLEGITRNDVCVIKDMDDDDMVRIYTLENATQRSNQGSARVGAVAAALRRLAIKEAEIGAEISAPNHRGGDRGGQGIGARQIAEYLSGINGVNVGTVQQDLASLKQSGEYASIIEEVGVMMAKKAEDARLAAEEARIAVEQARLAAEEARIAAERDAEDKRKADAAKAAAKVEAEAKAARAKANEATAKANQATAKATQATAKAKADEADGPTFDRAGVQQYFKNPAQLDVFRKRVTDPDIIAVLPVNRQAALAKHLIEEFQRQSETNSRVEFSGTFIRENINTLVLKARGEARQATDAEKERLARTDMVLRAKEAMTNFSGACRRMQAEGDKITKLHKQFPDGLKFPFTREFIEAVKGAKEVIDILNNSLNQRT